MTAILVSAWFSHLHMGACKNLMYGDDCAGKFAARFRQKVFKKSDFVIVSGSEPSSYNVGEEQKQVRKYDEGQSRWSGVFLCERRAF
jgi:hypothetical protein